MSGLRKRNAYSLLEDTNEDRLERRKVFENKVDAYTQRLERLRAIDPNQVKDGDEDYIIGCYEELGESFEPIKIQGLKNACESGEKVSFNGEYGVIQVVELTKDVDTGKMQAAFEAIYGVHAKTDVEFRSDFGYAKADVEGFLGAMGKTQATAAYNWNQVMLEAAAEFFAGAKLTCNGEVQAGSVENNLKATGNVKATIGIEGCGSGKLRITPTQLDAALKLSAFAGAKAEAKGTMTATMFGRELFKQSGSATASVGIGAELEAEAHIGVEKLSFGFAAGLTVGPGFGTSAKTEIQMGNVAMTFVEVADRIANAKAYINGYSNLGLQDEEWRRKIKSVLGVYEALIKDADKNIKKINEKLR